MTPGVEALAGRDRLYDQGIRLSVDAGQHDGPRHVAADLISQAEHDEQATCLLVTDSPKLAERVRLEVERQVDALPHPEIARARDMIRRTMIA